MGQKKGEISAGEYWARVAWPPSRSWITGFTRKLPIRWTVRGYSQHPIGQHVGKDEDADTGQPDVLAAQERYIRALHDVVHVAGKPGNDHHRHMRGDEHKVGAQQQEMDGSAHLPIARQTPIPTEAIHQRRRHRRARQDRKGRENENDREIRQLLQRVIPEEAIGLGREMEGGIVDEDDPGIGEDSPGGWDQPPPVAAHE